MHIKYSNKRRVRRRHLYYFNNNYIGLFKSIDALLSTVLQEQLISDHTTSYFTVLRNPFKNCIILGNCQRSNLIQSVSVYNNQTSGSTLDDATYARRVASTGVLQGDAANANVRPARYACTPTSQNIFISKSSKVTDGTDA